MTNAEMIAYFEETFMRLVELKKEKARDYTDGADSSDAFADVEAVSIDTALDPDHILFTFASKHWIALRRAVLDTPPAKRGESVFSRIDDLIVYLVMLRAYLEEEGERRRAPRDIPPAPAPIRLAGGGDGSD
jgi:hypothetical protein